MVWLREDELPSDTKVELRQLINYKEVFQDEQRCLEYIRYNAKEKIFLILSDSMAVNIVPKIHNLDRIQFIYIFCEYFLRYYISNSLANVEKHKQWTIYDDQLKLFSPLNENAQFLSKSTISIAIFRLTSNEKSIRELSKKKLQHLCGFIY